MFTRVFCFRQYYSTLESSDLFPSVKHLVCAVSSFRPNGLKVSLYIFTTANLYSTTTTTTQ